MANEFLTTKNIARQILPRLIENLVFPNLINKDFSDTYAKQGDTIRARLPVKLTAEDFTVGNNISMQDVKEPAVEVKLDKIADASAKFSVLEMATNVDDLNRLFVEPAAVAIAEKINGAGLGLYADIPNYAGTAATTPSSLEDLANAAKVLNDLKAPVYPRNAVWNTAADAKLKQIQGIVNASASGSTEALRAGSIGTIYGINNYMAQGVKTHVGGSAAGTLLVDGAVTAGATTIHIDGATAATATVKKGDLLTIANVQYVCTEDVTFASNEGDVKVYPAVPANIADNAPVAIVQNGAQNLVFHPSAFAFVTRPLAPASSADSYTVSYNGIAIRVTRGYDIKTKEEIISADVLYGYKTVYPELAVRYLG